jgi:hypothetical protein
MKFPIVFRIFAVLNILAFIICGIVALAMLTKPGYIGFWMISMQLAVTVWLLVAALAWFFASKNAFHFLYSLSLYLIALSAFWIKLIWFGDEFVSQSDKIITTAIPGIILLYVIFLVAAMLFKPVKEWSIAKVSLKHIAISIFVFCLIPTAMYALNKINRRVQDVDAAATFSRVELSNTALAQFNNSDWVRFDLQNQRAVNGISLKFIDSASAKPLRFARLYYSPTKKIDLRTTPNIIIEFSRKGENLVAEFDPITAKRIQLFPLNDNRESMEKADVFFVGEIKPVKISDFFTKANDDRYLETTTADADDEGNGAKITKANLSQFYELMTKETGFASTSEYMFDYSQDSMEISGGDGDGNGSIGMYKLGYPELSYYAQDAVKRFQEFEGYDNEKYLWALSGINLYSSKAKAYEFTGNGTSFNNLNPQIIAWAETYLIPTPETVILGRRAQEFYDITFKRVARMSALTYLYLTNNEIAAEAEAYKSAAETDDFYGPNYLYEKYKSIDLDEYELNEEGGWAESSKFIGFWLRRRIDNTDYKCWNALRKALLQYDKEWLLATESSADNLLMNP